MSAREAIKGAAWTALGKWAGFALTGAIFVVTARALGPEAYGVVAAGWLILSAPQLLLGKAALEALVQREEARAAHFDATFWLGLGLAALAAGVAFWAADALAEAFDAPALGPVLPWLCASLALEAARTAPAALLQRRMAFRPLVAAETAGLFVSSPLGLGLALSGFGVWSLVVAGFVHQAVALTITTFAARYRPRGFIEPRAVRELAMFVSQVFAASLFTLGAHQAPRLAIGLYAGPAALGAFSLAWQAFERLKDLLVAPLGAVALPATVRLKADAASFARMFERTLQFSAGVTYPAFVGVAVVAPVALPALFGEAWAGAAVLVQILMLTGLRAGVTALNGPVLKGFGRADLNLVLSGANFALAVVAALVAAPFGATAVALGVLAARALSWPVSAYAIARATGFSIGRQLRAGSTAGLAAAAMAAGVIGLDFALADRVWALWGLALQVSLGVLIYGAALYGLASREDRGLMRAAAGRALAGDLAGLKRLLLPV